MQPQPSCNQRRPAKSETAKYSSTISTMPFVFGPTKPVKRLSSGQRALQAGPKKGLKMSAKHLWLPANGEREATDLNSLFVRILLLRTLGVTPPFVKNCTLRPEFTRGIGLYPGQLDCRSTGPRSDQGCPGGRAAEAQGLWLIQPRGLTYNFLQTEE